jgi:pilus assembly protein CpaC
MRLISTNKLKHLIYRSAVMAAIPMMALGTATMVPAQDTAPTTAPAATNNDQVRRLSIRGGESKVIDAPWPVKRLSVTDPSVADVDLTSPRVVQIQGKAAGSTEVILWSEHGDVWQAQVEVEADISRLQADVRKMFPDSTIEAVQVGRVVMLKGGLARAEQVPLLHKYFELSKIDFIDATKVAGVQQVQLQVKVAEVSRTALRALGVNTVFGGSDFFGGVQIGSSAGAFTPMNIGIPKGTGVGNTTFQTINDVSVPATATMFGGFPNADLQVFIQALAENQYLRVLAEPTLIAYSGQEASFLAGGEFPVPVAQVGGGGTTEISIEYKEFGIRLRFRPTVLGDGRIHLNVMPEVSQLSDVGAIVIQGTRVPSVLSRRVQTALEVQSGQTFAIAGLLNRQVNARNSRVPGLGDMPILGSLFRSVRYETNETELLIMVTASLVEPTSTDAEAVLPGATHEPPNDWELYANGQIAGRPAPLSPEQAKRLQTLGLNGLKGPGGWASYDNAPNTLAGEEKK